MRVIDASHSYWLSQAFFGQNGREWIKSARDKLSKQGLALSPPTQNSHANRRFPRHRYQTTRLTKQLSLPGSVASFKEEMEKGKESEKGRKEKVTNMGKGSKVEDTSGLHRTWFPKGKDV